MNYVAIDNLIVVALAVAVVALVFVFIKQRITETQVRSGEKRLRAIFDMTSEGVIEIDHESKLVSWNTSGAEIFGLKEGDCGQDFCDVYVSEQDRVSVRATINALLDDPNSEERISFVCKTTPVKESSQASYLEVTAWINCLDVLPHVNLFVHDITERRRIEQERIKIEKAQRELVDELRRADQSKSDFVSTVSHELRTPLTSVVGYMEMLQDGYGGELSEQQVSMLAVMDRNARRLLSLIEDLLTLSRIESGVLKLVAVPIDVIALVVNIQQSFVPAMLEREIELEVDVDPDTGMLFGDMNQLERVLVNLTSNAMKFTSPGGHVQIRTWSKNKRVHVEIKDDGIGIPKEEQGRLFNRFYRASNSRERSIQGTGLGLAIVQSIIERHNGTVWLESELDKGTTVHVELPQYQSDYSNDTLSNAAETSAMKPAMGGKQHD